ncbi:MAG: hypothetical protein LKF87_14645 [Clostridium tyrobutyricum]|jgi:hypothetical protein|uniref:hypothetical protein n=1 Tax=Clostridium tyrobutyricum TaxID=1519 RepID=UPI00242AF39E|nr:hypothetical protein [Clostridium tyrobutyricum]MCH4200639.1 hypothetical protein [Clostridium tyrobutyricum]MCH4237537.1 hypothetical protein [Clostridium tyrobutyricum]MCH4260152.1 hypothetical protein [Clostridium tyrobutyricum]MCI2011738.1 hypothetical protein [Clostridium tyrobutyricum]
MEHQKQILYQRVDNLHSGINKTHELVDSIIQMLNEEDIDIKKVQKELEEMQDFLLWLAII